MGSQLGLGHFQMLLKEDDVVEIPEEVDLDLEDGDDNPVTSKLEDQLTNEALKVSFPFSFLFVLNIGLQLLNIGQFHFIQF